MNDLILRAIDLVSSEFHGITDKAGSPYINHLYKVASNSMKLARSLNMGDRRVNVVTLAALLHDLVEDTDWTVDGVALLFGHDVARVVDNVTKRDNESEARYNNRVISLLESVVVKAGDTEHNMDINRFESPTDLDVHNCERYSMKNEKLVALAYELSA